jgi:hypothetical protein
MLTFPDVKRAILASLTPDLLTPKWRKLVSKNDPPESGHCAVAAEAFYHLAGGKAAGFMPVVCGYNADRHGNMKFEKKSHQPGWHRETHWWVRGPDAKGQRGAGDIRDVTVGQYPGPFPYQRGHNVGFMQPQQKPSKRAQIVIDRVTEKLGATALLAYKQNNIRRYSLSRKRGHRPVPPV